MSLRHTRAPSLLPHDPPSRVDVRDVNVCYEKMQLMEVLLTNVGSQANVSGRYDKDSQSSRVGSSSQTQVLLSSCGLYRDFTREAGLR